jgi:hypothetical protein
MLLKSVHQKFSNVVLNMDGIDVTRTDTNKGKKCIIVDGFSFRINYYLKNPYLYLPGFTGKGTTGSKNFSRPNVTFFFTQMYTLL